MSLFKNLSFVGIVLLMFSSCSDDEGTDPQNSTATFKVNIENVLPNNEYMASGTTNFLAPGESQTIIFYAGTGSYLSFATMFVQSNDLFYAFDEKGLPLYDDAGVAKTGDLTSFIDLWDAGTEVNEEPGIGDNQAPRQAGPNTGLDENGAVAIVNDAFTYPTDESVIRVSMTHDGGTLFTLTLENISGSATLPSPLAPGVWAVHGENVQLFMTGQAASEGLERIAEDGDNSVSEAEISVVTGYTSTFAPGVYAIHTSDVDALFLEGNADFGLGLEALAEDGDPSVLNTSLTGATGITSNGVFNTPEGLSGAGPLLPGNNYSFTFIAEEGDYLSFATMLVHTNDLFYAFGGKGISLFENGIAIQGDLTQEVMLWDAGTEVNEFPGAGNNQPVRGGGNSGPTENGTVQLVNDEFAYPLVADGIRVNIEVVQ